MLYQSVHGKPMFGGYVARKVRDYYIEGSSPFHALLDMDPAPDPDILPAVNPLAVLNYYQIPYLIAYKQDEKLFTPIDRNHVLNYARSLFPDPASKVADDDLLTAYRVPTMTTIPAQAWVGDGWNGTERVEGRVWRWSLAQDAELHILTTAPISGPLRFTWAAFNTTAT